MCIYLRIRFEIDKSAKKIIIKYVQYQYCFWVNQASFRIVFEMQLNH